MNTKSKQAAKLFSVLSITAAFWSTASLAITKSIDQWLLTGPTGSQVEVFIFGVTHTDTNPEITTSQASLMLSILKSHPEVETTALVEMSDDYFASIQNTLALSKRLQALGFNAPLPEGEELFKIAKFGHDQKMRYGNIRFVYSDARSIFVQDFNEILMQNFSGIAKDTIKLNFRMEGRKIPSALDFLQSAAQIIADAKHAFNAKDESQVKTFLLEKLATIEALHQTYSDFITERKLQNISLVDVICDHLEEMLELQTLPVELADPLFFINLENSLHSKRVFMFVGNYHSFEIGKFLRALGAQLLNHAGAYHFENELHVVEQDFLDVLKTINVANQETRVDFCNVCKILENLKQCTRCKSVKYCSTDCQRKDWPSHKVLCNFGK